jgi:hypothetical protein
MDELLALIQDPAAQGSLYVTLVLCAMQILKARVVPAAWWTGPWEDKLRLLPVVLGVVAHWAFDPGAWAAVIMPGVQDGVIALGIFNGSKIVRKLGGG